MIPHIVNIVITKHATVHTSDTLLLTVAKENALNDYWAKARYRDDLISVFPPDIAVIEGPCEYLITVTGGVLVK